MAFTLYVAAETSTSGWIASQLHRTGYSASLGSLVTAGFWLGVALGRVAGGIPGTKLEAAGEGPAAFARIAAVSRALRAARKGSVALWDLGTDRSRVLLVTANGVEGVAPCSVGLGAVFEAVQMALKLKFRGAGARLFFNEGYDFTEPGPKICAIVGADLKQALGLLPKTEDPPALACIGLTGRQAWFIRDIAAVAGTSPWAPDIKKLAGDLGLKFADDAVAASFSPSSAGLFELLASTRRAKDAWPPAWTEVDGPEEEEVVEAPAPEEEPEPEELFSMLNDREPGAAEVRPGGQTARGIDGLAQLGRLLAEPF